MILKTFNEWSADGYQILKGSKAMWVEGVAHFSEAQVRKYTPRKRLKWSSADGPWQDDEYWMLGDPMDYGNS